MRPCGSCGKIEENSAIRGGFSQQFKADAVRCLFEKKEAALYAASLVFILVGAARFELTASCTRNKRATKLRHAPTTCLL